MNSVSLKIKNKCSSNFVLKVQNIYHLFRNKNKNISFMIYFSFLSLVDTLHYMILLIDKPKEY